MVNHELALHFALRSGDNVEVGILGGDIVVRRGGWLARMLRESCRPWLQEVLFVAERRLPMALATAHYTGGVLRIYRLGQPWVVLEGVSDHYVAIDFAAEVRRFRP
jgi:hypothetical protein